MGHYQFEAIHPFTDGNGHTGRILNLLYLVEQNLLDNVVDAGLAKRQTASEYLEELRDIGVLNEVKVGREKAVHPPEPHDAARV